MVVFGGWGDSVNKKAAIRHPLEKNLPIPDAPPVEQAPEVVMLSILILMKMNCSGVIEVLPEKQVKMRRFKSKAPLSRFSLLPLASSTCPTGWCTRPRGLPPGATEILWNIVNMVMIMVHKIILMAQ